MIVFIRWGKLAVRLNPDVMLFRLDNGIGSERVS